MKKLLLSSVVLFILAPVYTCSAQIRSIDWKNFTYPWYPADTNPPYRSRKITLVRGEFIVYANPGKKIENLSMSFANAKYSDLTGDGREEAIVTISGTETFNSFTGCIFVYSLKRGKLSLIWQHEIGDRGIGGLKDLKVVDRNLVIEQYNGRCPGCMERFRRSYYRWDGRRLRKIKSQTVAA